MISKKFTIEDIHKIRDENYEKTKNMSNEELIEHTRREAAEVEKIIEELRDKRQINKIKNGLGKEV